MSGINLFNKEQPDVFVGKSGAKNTNNRTIPSQNQFPVRAKSPLNQEDSVALLKKKEVLNSENPFSNEPIYMSDVKYKRHYEGEKPIPNMTVNVRGKAFDDLMYTSDATPYKIAQEVLSNEMIANNPELKDKMLEFAKNLDPKDKEAVIYMKTLTNRTPGLSVDDLTNVFSKLTSMMKEENFDQRIGNKKELVIAALHDIAEPSDISQEGIGTCTGTTVQIQLALRNPKEYLTMIDSLAKNKPYTTVTNKQIPPNWTFTEEGKDNKPDSRRTISAKIMQNAIMDFADSTTRNFDSSKGDGGLSYEQTADAVKDIMNQNVKTYEIWNNSPKQLVTVLEKSKPSIENPIEVSMTYQESGRDAFHSLSAVGIADGKIQIINPWGRQESFSIDDFQKRVMSVSGTKDLDIGIKDPNTFDPEIKKSILDDTKRDNFLSNMTNNKKADLIADISNLHFYTNPPSDKKLSPDEKKVLVHTLNSLLDGGFAQKERIYDLILNTIGNTNTNILLNRISDNSEVFTSVKAKMDELALSKASKSSNSSHV